MKGRSLLLLCAVSILFIILVAFVNLLNVGVPNVEGARDAYFTKVKRGTTAYEGKNFTWSLTTFNKNCSTDSEGRALFYFLFYLDGDLWWSEYNNTEYQTWPCKRGNSVTRSFSVPTWYSAKPAIHDLEIELYWHDGNASRLQDGVSFPVSVAVHVDRDNLVIYSYVVICLAAVLILGFYMTTTGPLPCAVSTQPQDSMSVSGKQIDRMPSSLPKTGWHIFLSFYFFVFASWQTINIVLREFSISEPVFPYMFLAVQIVYLGVLALLITRENSTFARYGFVWPEETGKYVAAILLFAFSYIFIASILPGISEGYTVFPTLSLTEIFSLVLSTLVASFAGEAIFRGYLQTKLTELSGFPTALLATSLMFSLYALPFLPFDPSLVFFQVLSLFVLGLFLGVLYYRTKTLLCPIVFYSAILVTNRVMSIEAVASEYLKFLLQLSAIGLSSLLLFVLTLKTGRETLDEEIVCEHALS